MRLLPTAAAAAAIPFTLLASLTGCMVVDDGSSSWKGGGGYDDSACGVDGRCQIGYVCNRATWTCHPSHGTGGAGGTIAVQPRPDGGTADARDGGGATAGYGGTVASA